ncbi:hypothetical protein WICANDRAFT_30791 [Wickerhamomyces anomalus NRRL Y-366-8]|uniref:Zinc-ribbon 15 domain-containing protein n=1 Tax=Wickerhamomyces anomalus (strain ATCC 58044 / CBS 1984 / NCYC 433 / NRRL Y-366-8) TaxID=683960 RepID=A0A1E3P3Z1_WICAA|nr:uncharacterized protein WICANDRAFT_30791 [Wickerhamomyces anomalus NRRL Y-366-8]ODQ60216.1 hypothetical protein WICANDRAFT_30791 [Wickerhamomyces anomalus NRRL Y-366-8]
MSFVPIIFGKKDMDSRIDGYPNNLPCPNCHNQSVEPVKRKEFISFWWIPLIPMYWGKQLKCNTCSWRQDVNKEELEKYGIKHGG